MLKQKWSSILFIFSLMAVLIIAGCGNGEEDTESDSTDNADSGEEEAVNYSEEVGYNIVGIEPGAGISVTTEKAIEEYDSLAGWTVDLSSTAAMMSELDKAISNEEPIIVTGWNPHWMFAAYPDLKYLEDPQEIYGGTEVIKTLVRQGLEEDKPSAYKLLEQFQWDVEDMEAIMYESNESGDDIADVAARWVEDNQDKVDAWKEGVEEVDGEEFELISTPWDSERASANVVATALEQVGYDVTITPVDIAVMFEGIANGDGDATVAAWMPMTHADFYNEHEGNFEDLGANLEGAKIGLTVPSYMDIDSIEDLEPAE
ncbi:glycine betaine ABC transporter substrate-binding protein [Oceanobacillus halotolerans]|uniref:glycine betaine ABC transporter substrate-binding protein n=1 Tax=Oceanobacillus halotolerans TaxID=2663380 RepID=UPI001CF7E0CB|nr:glycine betaine ABC transporter substrate-binding protein [Oceanobacillus halotolerans]